MDGVGRRKEQSTLVDGVLDVTLYLRRCMSMLCTAYDDSIRLGRTAIVNGRWYVASKTSVNFEKTAPSVLSAKQSRT